MPPRPRKTNGTRYRRTTAQVLREEDTCAWCGQHVDKTLPQYHPKAPAVDHIIPISKGGSEYDRANMQLMHRACNRAKSDKTEGPTAPLRHSQPW